MILLTTALITCGSWAQSPKGSRTADRSPSVERHPKPATDQSRYPTTDAPLPVRVLQTDEDAARGTERERKTDEFNAQYLDTQRRMAYAAEKQVFAARFVAGVAFIDTVVAAIALGFLWRSYKETRRMAIASVRTARTASAQTRLARDEFNYVHRPRLVIRREQIRFEAKDNGINLVLANIGDLAAADIVGQFNVKILPVSEAHSIRNESLPPYGSAAISISDLINRPPRSSPNLEGDTSVFIYVPCPEITSTSLGPVKGGMSVLYFFGFIEFLGPSGRRGRSAFFRTYNALAREFAASDDPDYEHH